MPFRLRCRPAEDRRGFALLAVLWVLVLASALAAELHGTVRADQRVAGNARAAAQARWAARGGLARVREGLRVRLATPSAVGAFVVTDLRLLPTLDYTVDGVRVQATVTDARARVQLNLATEDELRRLFALAGFEPRRAAAAAAAIADWRARHAPPALPTPQGETSEDTAGAAVVASLRLRPPRGAFTSLAELRGVPGLLPAEVDRVSPLLTVASDGRINLNTAPPEVLATLPGMDPEAAETVVERRRMAPYLSPYEVLEGLPRASAERLQLQLAGFMERVAFGPRAAEVEVLATPPASPVRARLSAVAVLTGGAAFPVIAVVER